MKLALDTYMTAGLMLPSPGWRNRSESGACAIDRSNCIFSSATFMRVDVQIVKDTYQFLHLQWNPFRTSPLLPQEQGIARMINT